MKRKSKFDFNAVKTRKKSKKQPEFAGEMTIDAWSKKAKLVEPEAHLIENILPDSPGAYGIVAARTGLGKTNTSFHLGFCLATGRPYFGIRCSKVGVSMLAFEGGAGNLGERIEKIRRHFPRTGDQFHFNLAPADTPDEVQEVLMNSIAAAKDRGDKVLLVDPIKYLVRGDYLDTKDAGNFTLMIQAELRKAGLVGIFSFPIRKPPSFKGLVTFNDVYSVKGATEWVDTSTFVILAEKQARVDSVNINFPKHRVSRIGSLESILVRHDDAKCMFVRILKTDSPRINMDLSE